jgi:polar amino acid transport system substrate-binding protein
LAFCQDSAALQVRTIGVSPYGIEKNDAPSGIYYELAEMLASDLDCEIEHYIYPYARIIHELKLGQTDLTIMFKYKELEEYVVYIAALPAIKNVVVGLKTHKYSSVADLQGKTIAYLRGAQFNDVIDNDNRIKKAYTQNFRKAVEMLVAGRVDAIIGPYEAILSAAKNTGFSKRTFGKPLVVSERVPWLQMSKLSRHKALINRLYKSFENIIQSSKLDKLRVKYTS